MVASWSMFSNAAVAAAEEAEEEEEEEEEMMADCFEEDEVLCFCMDLKEVVMVVVLFFWRALFFLTWRISMASMLTPSWISSLVSVCSELCSCCCCSCSIMRRWWWIWWRWRNNALLLTTGIFSMYPLSTRDDNMAYIYNFHEC